jgi:hypothetical protein
VKEVSRQISPIHNVALCFVPPFEIQSTQYRQLKRASYIEDKNIKLIVGCPEKKGFSYLIRHKKTSLPVTAMRPCFSKQP